MRMLCVLALAMPCLMPDPGFAGCDGGTGGCAPASALTVELAATGIAAPARSYTPTEQRLDDDAAIIAAGAEGLYGRALRTTEVASMVHSLWATGRFASLDEAQFFARRLAQHVAAAEAAAAADAPMIAVAGGAVTQ